MYTPSKSCHPCEGRDYLIGYYIAILYEANALIHMPALMLPTQENNIEMAESSPESKFEADFFFWRKNLPTLMISK